MSCKEIKMDDRNGLLEASQHLLYVLSGLKEKQGFLFLFCSGFVFVYAKDVCVSEVYTFQLPVQFAVVVLIQ